MSHHSNAVRNRDFSVREGEAGQALLRKPRRSTVSEREILHSLGEVLYQWSLADDVLHWGPNAVEVLQVGSEEAIASGRRYAALLDPENITSPYDAVVFSSEKDLGSGVPYQLQYCLRPRGEEGPEFWIEDTGRWFAGNDGKPAKAHGAIRIINDRHEQEERMAFLSRYDELTGQFNRSRFVEVVGEVIENARRFRSSAGVLIAAIDNLAVINDCYGFKLADEVIAMVARRIKSRLRGGDALGRFSGNKLGILLHDCDEKEISIAAMRLIRAVCDEVIMTEAGPVAASVTLGGVVVPRHGQNSGDALARSLDALDQARRKHPGSFVIFHPSRAREAERKRNIKASREVVEGLKKDLFRFAYQPIVDSGSGETMHYECLLRLDGSDGAMTSAREIMPFVERLGLSRLIDRRVMELVLADLEEDENIHLAVNMTSASAGDPDWLSLLAKRFRQHAGMAQRLTIEITETMALHNIEAAREFVEMVKGFGCRVAIDDFGAGYTSFRNLKLFDIDMVKIDGEFIRQLPESPEDQVFVRTLIELAQTFGVKTVAEWVNDARSVDLLRAWGVDMLQGHYCGVASFEKPWRSGECTDAVPGVEALPAAE